MNPVCLAAYRAAGAVAAGKAVASNEYVSRLVEDEELRASCERPALAFGRHLVVNRRRMTSIDEVHAVARLMAEEAPK